MNRSLAHTDLIGLNLRLVADAWAGVIRIPTIDQQPRYICETHGGQEESSHDQ